MCDKSVTLACSFRVHSSFVRSFVRSFVTYLCPDARVNQLQLEGYVARPLVRHRSYDARGPERAHRLQLVGVDVRGDGRDARGAVDAVGHRGLIR